MREIGNDLQAAKGLLEQLESKLSDLNELDVFEDKYPNKTPSENETQTISKIENALHLEILEPAFAPR